MWDQKGHARRSWQSIGRCSSLRTRSSICQQDKRSQHSRSHRTGSRASAQGEARSWTYGVKGAKSSGSVSML
eukprot:3663298-Rhodomonas_salina.1